MTVNSKDIPGYENLYSINEEGKIWMYTKKFLFGRKHSSLMCIEGKFLKCNDFRGYKRIHLRNGKERKNLFVHQLVARTFIPNPENKPCVNHKNGMKSDNRVSNLEWCTVRENNEHSIRMGLFDLKGEKNHKTPFKEKDILEIREKYKSGLAIPVLAQKYKVTSQAIRQIVNRKSWKHI